MTTTIRNTAAATSIRHPPPMRFPVDVKAMANDPAQKVSVTDRTVTIKGTANNRGIVRSFVQLSFNGQKVNVSLSGGETPAQVREKLRKALPEGYTLSPRPSAPGTSSFQILKSGGGVPVGPQRINEAFAAATKKTSQSGELVNVAELRKAVQAGLGDGKLDAAEKDALARNWASLFTGAGYQATAAAKKEYAKLQKKYDLPVYPVR